MSTKALTDKMSILHVDIRAHYADLPANVPAKWMQAHNSDPNTQTTSYVKASPRGLTKE